MRSLFKTFLKIEKSKKYLNLGITKKFFYKKTNQKLKNFDIESIPNLKDFIKENTNENYKENFDKKSKKKIFI